jgi:hypothetical protein
MRESSAAHWAAGTLYPLKGDWEKARSRIEQGIAVVRTANVVLLLPIAVAFEGLIENRICN